MKLAGADANLRPHAELGAVGELRRGVPQHDGGIERGEEALGSGAVLGHDALGVMRAVLLDVRDRFFDAIDGFHSDNGVEIFRRPVFFRRSFGRGEDGAHRVVTTDFTASFGQSRKHVLANGRQYRAVDQQRLGRAAHRYAAHLCVQRNSARLGRIGLRVEIDVADAFEMRQHRHARLAHHASGQALAAARDDEIDRAAQTLQHQTNRSAIRGRHTRDRGFRQAGGTQTFQHRVEDRRRGA